MDSSSISAISRPQGMSTILHNKIKVRLLTKAVAFSILIVFFWMYSYFSNSLDYSFEMRSVGEHATRSLDNSCAAKADPPAMVIVYIVGVLYIFFSIAIVSDELFVPALDVISGNLGLSEDVAGATLMAAGGSSPELFTNLIGTFLRSDVGFGAIVGSAVFNILFVVGICAVVTGGALQLSPWPLLRDSSYYVVVLITLAMFFGVNSPGILDWYEALILHLLYFLYVFIMYHNTDLKIYLTSKKSFKQIVKLSETPANSMDNTNTFNGSPKDAVKDKMQKANSTNVSSNDSDSALLRVPTRFRAGIHKQLTHQHERSVLETTGIAMACFDGQKTLEMFQRIDKDNSNFIETDELKQLFTHLGHDLTEEELAEAMKRLDKDENGKIDYNEFETWYLSSIHRLNKFVETLFNKFDTNKDGVINPNELFPMFKELCDGRTVTEDEVHQYYSSMDQEPGGGVSLSSFEEWFSGSQIQKERKYKLTIETQAIEGLSLLPPKGADYNSLFWFLLAWPLVFLLYVTVPDVRRPSQKNYCYVAFLICLCWMGFLSYFMVSWIELIGSTFGIPSVLMGLTFLALGTSVPDMFSAIIVAKQGKGSQAVSSSVGSNVFDITVGLAVPWLLFWAVYQEPVVVTADSLMTSILGVVGAVIALVGMIWFSGWVLTSKSGYVLLTLYAAYVGWQAGTAQYGQC